MQHPYQCVAAIEHASGEQSRIVVACGSQLSLVDATDGTVLSKWNPDESLQAASQQEDGDEERPKKKQKTAKVAERSRPVVIKLAISPDNKHVVAVTDDKYVRVFSVVKGHLEELSQRCMPKRPCALKVLPDNATIICGDKFGDVYSLPLLPSEPTEQDATPGAVEESGPVTEKTSWKPSATNLTVHTVRNRKTLEAQMQQKKFSTKKEPLKFEHKLLLGHVSMLTDITFATHQTGGKDRGYIITADRDEHIRVSRGPPQAHIIENFCLGHKEFISKLCLIPGTKYLVSGGGDDWLGVWDWQAGVLHRKIALNDDSWMRVPSVSGIHNGSGDDPAPWNPALKTVVSGLWTVPYRSDKGDETALAIALEKYAGLLVVPTERLQLKTHREFGLTHIALDHPVLDIASVGDSMVVSLDARESGQARSQAFRLQHEAGARAKWHVHSEHNYDLEERLKCLDTEDTGTTVNAKTLDDLLYNVGSLRKRRGWAEVGDEGGVVEGELAEEDTGKMPAAEDTAGD